MNEKTTIRFVLTGVKYSQSDLGKHYKTFCGLYLNKTKRQSVYITVKRQIPHFNSIFTRPVPKQSELNKPVRCENKM